MVRGLVCTHVNRQGVQCDGLQLALAIPCAETVVTSEALDNCCRAVAVLDEEKLQQAKAMMEAADGEVLGAQSLPIGSDWPVVSLVRRQGKEIPAHYMDTIMICLRHCLQDLQHASLPVAWTCVQGCTAA